MPSSVCIVPAFPILVPATLLAILLLIAAWGDIRARDIPNWLNGAMAMTAPLWWWAGGLVPWPDIAIQFAAAAIVFAFFAACFHFGMMGGGDVKMLTALALCFTPIPFIRMLVIMALAGGVLTLFMVVRHRLGKAEGRPEIPYGVAIAFAGLWIITNDILTISGH